MIGTIHVGWRTMDWKVALGLNRTPKMRAKELLRSGTSADGRVALAMSILQNWD